MIALLKANLLPIRKRFTQRRKAREGRKDKGRPQGPSLLGFFHSLFDLADERAHVHGAEEHGFETPRFEPAWDARGTAGDDPDGHAFRPERQSLDIGRGIVTRGDVRDEKHGWGWGGFQAPQGLFHRGIGFHAEAFLEQLRSKQGASLPVLGGDNNHTPIVNYESSIVQGAEERL